MTTMDVRAGVSCETFRGVFPCTGGGDLSAELRLYRLLPSSRPLRYELLERYTGVQYENVITRRSGRWCVLRRSAAETDATIYQLDYDRPETRRDFLKVGTNELRLLDREQREIPSLASHSLYRAAIPPFVDQRRGGPPDRTLTFRHKVR